MMMGRRFDVGNVTLNIGEAGEGSPLLLFLHGITANRGVWDPVIRILSKDFRCVALDQRGHGESDKPSSGYSDNDYSDDIAGLVEELSPNSAVYLVGHSLGARNAIVAGFRFPHLIKGVVALDFVPFIEPEVFDALERRVIAGSQEFSTVEGVRDYLQDRYPNLPHDAIGRRVEFGYIRGASGAYTPRASAGAMEETVKGLRADLETPLRNLAIPAVIVRGENSLLVSEKAFEKAKVLNHNVSNATVAGADHYIPEEAPEAVAEIVLSLINNK
jgi:2-(acetamidomethylene)succinate hydrolase